MISLIKALSKDLPVQIAFALTLAYGVYLVYGWATAGEIQQSRIKCEDAFAALANADFSSPRSADYDKRRQEADEACGLRPQQPGNTSR